MSNTDELRRTLARVITEALGGPGGDPDFHHHMAAAGAFKALKLLGLPLRSEHVPDYEESVRRTLRNIPFGEQDEDQQGNLYNIDFLAEVGWPPERDEVQVEARAYGVCPDCQEPQYECPSGVVCKNGHGY
jgi:hypothetical protein